MRLLDDKQVTFTDALVWAIVVDRPELAKAISQFLIFIYLSLLLIIIYLSLLFLLHFVVLVLSIIYL